jgi:cytosine/adenosine deaminase-related metal-dependent hydrolase
MRAAITFLVLALAPAAARPAAMLRYTVVISGHVAGAETVSIDGSEHTVHSVWSDRGRGPELEAHLRIGADGTLATVVTTGKDYLKAPVDERFSLAAGKASWKNEAERGESAVTGAALYVSFDSTFYEYGLLAHALLANGGELPLLPEGRARLERAGEHSCPGPGGARTVTLYAIGGLDFLPTSLWLDADGTLFGFVSAWISAVREGYEGCIEPLVAAQDQASAARLSALARAASHRPDVLVIRGARLFDPATMTATAGTSVLVRDGAVAAVGPDATVVAPGGAEVVEARGRTLLPGLWDMHVHLGDGDGPLDIAAGITTVRDLANDVDALAKLRRAWDAGEAVGPRVIPAGIIDGRGPFAGPTKVLVSTREEALSAVADYAKRGYPQVKIYSSVAPELVPVIAAAAHTRGMRVSGHVPAFMTAEQAVRAGYDEIQHVNMIVLGFWPDVKDTRTPARFTAVAERAALLDLDSRPVQALVSLLKERGTVVDPTLNAFEGMFVARAGTVSPTYASVASAMPAAVRRSFLGGGLPVPEGMDGRYRDSFRALERVVRLLHDRGVTLVAGTDGMAGYTLPRELELYVEAGIPAPEVLRMATLGAARVMKRDAELGAVVPGARADMVLVDGDPLTHIGDVRRTVLVVKDGRMYDPAVLRASLGIGDLLQR